ncbi:MAG: YheU family protein [Pseudomonadales bacterium]|nr:YheU family protein [Pseudomonadales bacterium]
MDIPWQSLSEEALNSVIQEFVLREGTEYGASEVSLEKKVSQIMAQLKSGKVVISFDKKTSTTTLRELFS